MGMNYYIKEKFHLFDLFNDVEHTSKHIGKSSGGWCFSLHVYPDEGIHDLKDWISLFFSGKYMIFDEDGEKVSPEVMMKIITEREWPYAKDPSSPPGRYESWAEFHRLNHSFDGPRNLLRHKVDGAHCISNGEGTWDCIIGNFS